MSKILVVGLSGESIFLGVDHFNQQEETIFADSIFYEPGGKGFNQAYALSNLSKKVWFITCLGKSHYNDEIIKSLVNIKTDIIYKDFETDKGIIITNKEGENKVIVYKKASSNLKVGDFKKYEKEMLDCDCLLLQLEFPIEITTYLINLFYNNHKTIILNPAPAYKLDDSLLEKVTYLIPNSHEVCVLGNSSDINKAIKNIKTKTIICTRGKESIIYKENDLIKEIKVNTLTPVDTTGAGDIFSAYFTYFIQSESLEESIIKASNYARISVTKKGVINSINYLKTIVF